MEEKDTHHANQNDEDPAPRFFENQITFLDCYVIPLVETLDTVGVFGRKHNSCFNFQVSENRRRWLEERRMVCNNMINA